MNGSANERQCVGVFGKGRADDQCFARAERSAQKVDELGRAVAEQHFRRAHAVAFRQSRLQFLTIKIGIARDFSIALDERFARRWRRPQGIDAGAEVEKLAGFDAGAACAGVDIAAVRSVEGRL